MTWNFLPNILIDLTLITLPLLAIGLEKQRAKGKTRLKDAMQELGFKNINAMQLAKKTIKLFALLALASFTIGIILVLAKLDDTYKVAEAVSKLKFMPIVLVYILVVRVTAEEVFFRGFLVKRAGIVLSAALFALAHLMYGSIAEVIGAFILGLILAKAFQLNKNLYPNILAHIAYNIAALTLFYF